MQTRTYPLIQYLFLTILTLQKTAPTHFKTLIDSVISDLSLNQQSNKTVEFWQSIKTDHLAIICITDLRLPAKSIPNKRKILAKKIYLKKNKNQTCLESTGKNFTAKTTPSQRKTFSPTTM